MAIKKKVATAKRFGPRYGGRLREKLHRIEKIQKKKHTCPFCKKNKVSRLSVGIWFCSNCSSKFAGKAYTAGV